MMQKGFSVFLTCFYMSCWSYGQQISGRVYDKTTHLQLAEAVVFVSTGNSGTITDQQGYFSFKAALSDTLVISFVGYKTLKIAVSDTTGFYQIGLDYDDVLLKDIVVSAFNMDQKLDQIPGAVSVLTHRELHRDNNTTIIPAINRITGVLMQSGALNTNRLTIRGIGARSLFTTTKIRAYFNNIPLTTGDGETTIEDIDVALIARSEVIKGPASSIYGAGLGGTVLLQSSKNITGFPQIHTEIITGSYGLRKSNTSLMIGNEKTNLGIAYNYLHSDGYRENNTYDRQVFTITGQVRSGDQGNLSILITYIDLLAFIPSSVDSVTFYENPRTAAPTWANTQGFEDYQKGLTGISYNHYLSNKISFDASVFASFRKSYELRPFNILDENSSAGGTRNIISILSENRKLKSSMGFEYFIEHYDWGTFINDSRNQGARLSDNTEIRKYVNVFAQMQYEFNKKLSGTLGVNLNKTSYNLDDRFTGDSLNQSGSYAFMPVLSPRIALKYRITASKNMYALISHGFSPPSFSETLTPDGLINPDIQPETGYNFEAGFKGRIVAGMYFDLAIYSMQIDNLIVAQRVAEDQFIGRNAGKTSHNGVETNIRYVYQWNRNKIIPFVSYTYARYKFVDFKDNEFDHSGNDLTGVPDHLLNTGVDLEFHSGFYGNVNYHFVGAMPMRDDNSKYSNAYGITNIKAGWKQAWEKLGLKVFAGISNLFDIKYASMILVNAPSFGGRAPRYYYPGLPVNYYGGLKVSYRF